MSTCKKCAEYVAKRKGNEGSIGSTGGQQKKARNPSSAPAGDNESDAESVSAENPPDGDE